MGKRDKIAFGIYFLLALSSVAFGVVYLFCSTIMPYHRVAIGIPWEQLSSGLQALLQGLIKVAAAGFLVTGISFLALLIIPFRRGDLWAKWLIPILGSVWNIIALNATIMIAMKTPAVTPWPAAIAAMVLLIIAFILAPGFGKSAN
jgi:hypothetical protein